MNWIDGHLDLAYTAQCGCDLTAPFMDPAKFCITLPTLREAGVDLAFATIFTEPGGHGAHCYPSSDDRGAAEQAGMKQLAIYQQLQATGELYIVQSKHDLNSNASLRIVLLMEGADPIRSASHLEAWHQRGLRIVGLTWAAGTRYAGGNARGGGLTSEGRELVAALDEFEIVHDASHLSDAAFDEVLELARGPVIASHSNCRALLEPKERHLRDDQIRAIAERNGIIGLNLYSRFLAIGRRATVADCIDHVEHVASIAGRHSVALGSDMDGGFPPADLPENVDDPRRLEALAKELRRRGWSEAEIFGFKAGNWLRLLLATLK